MSKLKTILVSVVLMLAISNSAFANGLSLNSVGTRALGMGGAFVGLANDATAIYWNPAGLAGQQSSILVFGTDIIPFATYKMDYSSMGGPNIDAKTNTNHYIAPNAFFNYNMGKLSLGLGVYVPAGLGAEWESKDFTGLENLDFLSKIGVVNISPAVAYQVTDKFSVGVALNVYYAMFDLSQPVQTSPTTGVQFEEESTGMGFGATIGLKYDINEMFSLGATFRTKTNVTMNGTAKNPALAFYGAPTESSFDRDVAWPTWVAGGIAVKPNDKLTIVLDGQYSMWSENQELVAIYEDASWDAIMSSGGDDTFELKWEDALQVRVGLEYLVTDALTLRGGYYYDPAPSPDETVNVLFPSSTNNVITGGLSYAMGQMIFAGGAEYLLGAERDIELNSTNAMPGLHQMDIFAFSVGFTYLLK